MSKGCDTLAGQSSLKQFLASHTPQWRDAQQTQWGGRGTARTGMGASHFHPLQKARWPWKGPRGTQLSPDPQAFLPVPLPNNPKPTSLLPQALPWKILPETPLSSHSASSLQMAMPTLAVHSAQLGPGHQSDKRYLHWQQEPQLRMGQITVQYNRDPSLHSSPGIHVGAEGRAQQGLWVPFAS